jgi:myo-inositol 2-dehydrogenase / D-chiro-inositol 1-dehydrogenase
MRVGVLGAGRIGRLHADLLAHRVAGAELAGTYDVDPTLATVGAVEDLFELSDVIAICTSTDTHADLIVAAARAGKAIFCEKPVSLDLAELDRALAAVEEAGVPFGIGFNRRFDPAHGAVRDAVLGGRIGEPQLVRISSRDPAPPPLDYVRVSGGIFLDMTIHDFDMARFVTGSEVVEVYARGGVRIDPEIGDAGDLDTAVILLEHANGCLTTIDNSRQAVYGYDQRVEVFGPAGMAASDNPLAHSAAIRTQSGMRAATLPYFYLERYIPSYLREWEAFVAAVGAGEAPPVTGVDARAPLVIGMAAWRSVRESRAIAVAEVERR